MKKLLLTSITTLALFSSMFGLSYHKSYVIPSEIPGGLDTYEVQNKIRQIMHHWDDVDDEDIEYYLEYIHPYKTCRIPQ